MQYAGSVKEEKNMDEEDKVNESILDEISIQLKVLIGNKDKHLFSPV